MRIVGIAAVVTVLACHHTTGHDPTGHPWMLTFGALLIIAAGSWLYRIPEQATELAGIARGERCLDCGVLLDNDEDEFDGEVAV